MGQTVRNFCEDILRKAVLGRDILGKDILRKDIFGRDLLGEDISGKMFEKRCFGNLPKLLSNIMIETDSGAVSLPTTDAAQSCLAFVIYIDLAIHLSYVCWQVDMQVGTCKTAHT